MRNSAWNRSLTQPLRVLILAQETHGPGESHVLQRKCIVLQCKEQEPSRRRGKSAVTAGCVLHTSRQLDGVVSQLGNKLPGMISLITFGCTLAASLFEGAFFRIQDASCRRNLYWVLISNTCNVCVSALFSTFIAFSIRLNCSNITIIKTYVFFVFQ